MKEPASPNLRSETAIIAGIAKAVLPHTKTPWLEYAADYNLIRDKMAEFGPERAPNLAQTVL